jgi:ComF family protein
MSALSALREGLSPMVDLVYPPRCPLCGSAIGAQTGLCSECWSAMRIPGEPCCTQCQRPFDDAQVASGTVCAPCLAAPPQHDGIAAGTLYGDGSRRLVLAFKHGRRIALASFMARLIAARLPAMEGSWLIVPVPLHRWRLWSRGYNQAALLGGALARLTGQPLAVDAMIRVKRTPMLGGLGRKARAKALSGALTVNPRRAERIRGAHVILVDDVLTSGATTDACVRVLKRAGAAKVVVACFARVMAEASGDRVDEFDMKNETPGA